MRKVKKVLSFHFEEGRSGHFIARHCGMARRSVAQTLERFAVSGLSWPQARDLDTAIAWDDADCLDRLDASFGMEDLERQGACGLVGLDCRQRRVVSVRGMAEKQETHNGHGILVRRQSGIGSQIVGDLPEPRLELFDANEMFGSRGTHVISLRTTVLPGMRSRLPSSSATIGSRKALQSSSSRLVSSTERQSTAAVHLCA